MSFGAGVDTNSTSMNSLINQLFNTSTNSNQQSTGTQNGTQTSTGTTTGTENGNTSRNLSPEQVQAQSQLGKIISALSTNPQKFLAPAQNQAREGVNADYSGVADSLRSQFMGGAGAPSGKYGTAAIKSDMARRGQLAGVDSSFASQAAMLPITASGIAQQLLNTNLGQSVTGTQTGTQTGTGTTTGTTTGSTTGTSNTTGNSSQSQTGNSNSTGVKVGGGFSL